QQRSVAHGLHTRVSGDGASCAPTPRPAPGHVLQSRNALQGAARATGRVCAARHDRRHARATRRARAPST
ncbi:hypothetical protein HK405_015485, partial [Cladochytrium tenue]